MSVSLLVYVHGESVEIDVHPQFYKKYANLAGEEVHSDTPERISNLNQEFEKELRRTEDLVDRRPVTKKMAVGLLDD